MPVTPFHGGLGLLAKGIGPGRFSFVLFACTQVAIDMESGYYLLREEWPVHRLLHTLPGALVVSMAVALLMRRPVERVLSWLVAGRPDLAIDPQVTHGATLTTGVLGAVCHVVPDGIMHSDVRPFAPFTDANPWSDLIALGPLHVALVVCGVVGVGLLALRGRAS
ncbi:MAG: hypothetical protein AB7U83_17420 [Vicinamibacterales bacterium]